MIPSEFEEKSYEAPLYNQLERGHQDIFTPGQVLESHLGFDRGLQLVHLGLWEILGYDHPLPGAALAYYHWPWWWGPRNPGKQLPRFRLNLFLQAKRPSYYNRKPRLLKNLSTINAPLWGFKINAHQQLLLETLSAKTTGRAHVAYAAAAFHTNQALFAHTRLRSIVQNSTFPSVDALKGHKAWYYQKPGAEGVANPDPEVIHERPLIDRVRAIAHNAEPYPSRNLEWLHVLAADVIASAGKVEEDSAANAQFFDDLQTLDRFAEASELTPTLKAYSQVTLFTVRFELDWLIVGEN